METWGDILNRQEREKEQLRTNRTLAWEAIKTENPGLVPEPLMQRWRAEYGDEVLARLEVKHKEEYRAYFQVPEQTQTDDIDKAPKDLEQAQIDREQKQKFFQEQAEEILKRNQERSKDRSRD